MLQAFSDLIQFQTKLLTSVPRNAVAGVVVLDFLAAYAVFSIASERKIHAVERWLISGCRVVAALYFGGKHKLACTFLQEQGYIPQMVSKSQFSRQFGCPLGATGLPVSHLISGVRRELQRTERRGRSTSSPLPLWRSVIIFRAWKATASRRDATRFTVTKNIAAIKPASDVTSTA